MHPIYYLSYLLINKRKETEVAANNVVAVSVQLLLSPAHSHLKYAKDRILPLNLHFCKVYHSMEQHARN